MIHRAKQFAALALVVLTGGALRAAQPPVILVDGYHLLCESDNSTSTPDFGELEQRLTAQGIQVRFFGSCSISGKPSIERLGIALGAMIQAMNVPAVDIVSHSMGGLVVRSYLSGKQPTAGVFTPPVDPKVRKWISIATPNFGALIPPIISDFLPDVQAREMVPGSQFLFDLATWNQNSDDLRGVDALGLVGNAGGLGILNTLSDGTVAMISASLNFAEPPQRTRVFPYCHGSNGLTSILGLGCSGPPIAKIEADNPLSWQAILSFLTDTDQWKTTGTAADQDPVLTKYGGTLTQTRTNLDQPTGSIQDSGAITNPPRVGTYTVVINKPGLRITMVLPSAARLPFLSLTPRMLISVYGTGLAGSAVTLGGTVLPQLYGDDRQINVILPGDVTGAPMLTVSNAAGQQSVRIVIEDAVPAIFTADGTGTGTAAALKQGQFAEVFLTGLGLGTSATTATIDGVPAPINYAGPAPGYPGLDQVNVQLPAGSHGGTLVITSGRHSSNPVQLPVF